MLDTVHLERMGIPTVVMVTEPFAAVARINAAAAGMPGIKMVVIPHDYLSEDEGAVGAKVTAVIPELLDKLFLGG